MNGWWVLVSFLAFFVPAVRRTADLRNVSNDTFGPNSNAVRVGQEHCRKYWAKHRAQYAANTRYLAVEAAAVFPAEIVNYLGLKLINSETANDFFAHGDRFTYPNLDLKGILIYATLNDRFVSTLGYLSVDLPRRDQ